MTRLRAFVMFAMAVTLACSSNPSHRPDGGGAEVGGQTGDLLPLQIGNAWTYTVSDPDGTISSEVVSVVSMGAVGGEGPFKDETAFKLVTGNEINDPNGDLSWEAVVGSRVIRYREMAIDGQTGLMKNEQYWDPPRLRLDQSPEHTAAGASWREPSYTEVATDWDTDPDAGTVFIPDGGMTSTPDLEDLWAVVSPSQEIVVPAGTFKALALRRVSNGGSSIKNYWYARGVGLIRQTEEGSPSHALASYRLLP